MVLSFFVFIADYAAMNPVEGILPIKEYPVIYVNTVDNSPIDQKEVYIDATAWFDASGCEDIESIGSEESPLEVGIRGRGNASWLADGPKPYKMKFEKKQPFFGLTKNKHWVLLPVTSYGEFYNNLIGFEIGRQIGLKFLPKRYPVQLVLNGTFVGLYMLGENIRIDEGRVDIFEQPDNNEDVETVPYGWLVEVDNYSDPCQIRIPNLNYPGRYTRITYHTPESLSEIQNEWLTNQFTSLSVAAHKENVLDREWENYVDIDGLARYFITQEILNNYDAYLGSWYMHKDKNENDQHWQLGPLWDLGWSLDKEKTSLVCEIVDDVRYPNFMDDIIRFPEFLSRANRILEEYVDQNPVNWIDGFCDSLHTLIDAGLELNRQVWPELSNRLPNYNAAAKRFFKENIEYLRSRFNTDLKTYKLNIDIERIDDDLLNIEDVDSLRDAIVLVDGLRITEGSVKAGQSVTLNFESNCGRYPTAVFVNDSDRTDDIVDGSFVLEEIGQDLNVKVTFSPITFIPPVSLALDCDTLKMLPGETCDMTVTVEPMSAEGCQLTWKSDNEEIAEVTDDGSVTALSPGTTDVTVYYDDDVKAVCRIVVAEPDVDYGDDDALIYERIYIAPGKTRNIEALIKDLDIVGWVSSDTTIATVQDGHILAADVYGETNLRAKDQFGRTVAFFEVYLCPTIYIEHGEGTIYAHHLLFNSRPSVYLGSGNSYRIAGATHNGECIPDENIEDGYYNFPTPVKEDVHINLAIELNPAVGVVDCEPQIRLLVNKRTLTIEGVEPGSHVTINNMAGQTVFSEAGTEFYFDVPDVYIVKIENHPGIYKILIVN